MEGAAKGQGADEAAYEAGSKVLDPAQASEGEGQIVANPPERLEVRTGPSVRRGHLARAAQRGARSSAHPLRCVHALRSAAGRRKARPVLEAFGTPSRARALPGFGVGAAASSGRIGSAMVRPRPGLVCDRTADGNTAPIRMVEGVSTEIVGGRSVGVEHENDEIAVASFGDGFVRISCPSCRVAGMNFDRT